MKKQKYRGFALNPIFNQTKFISKLFEDKTVVVLAVNFRSVIFEEQEINLAVYGVGYALPIIALAYFMKIRHEMRSIENKHPISINETLCQYSESLNHWKKRENE
ncbi:MAG: hypothetical protein EHM20_13700 [Alphaproteobacteria bacterium]|nr:MAG: hypothetical protein EHM20_13700 [Alphaproteobacteria bacterium]